MMEIFSASSVPCSLSPTTHLTDQVINWEHNWQAGGETRMGYERHTQNLYDLYASLAPLFTLALALPQNLVQFAPC